MTTDGATTGELIQCSSCGSSGPVQIRFAACGASTHWRSIGPTGGFTDHFYKDDILRWRIPLCMNCLPKGYGIFLRNNLKKIAQQIKVGVVILLCGIPVFIFMAANPFHYDYSQPILLLGTIFGAALIVAMIVMACHVVRWLADSRRLRAFEGSGAIPEQWTDKAFLGEGERIISALSKRGNSDSTEKVYGTFLLPDHITVDSLEETNKMLKDSKNPIKQGTEVRLIGLPIEIVAIGRTMQEMEQRLPQNWKSVWEEIVSIHHAAREGNFDQVKEVIRNRPELVKSTGKNSATPLHEAVGIGRTDIAAFLLAKGADVNARAKNDVTPLHQAAVGGHSKVAELLLANKAKVDAKNNKGVTPLHTAAFEGHKDVAELLLAHKAEVDAKTNKGVTPLHNAAFKGHKDVAELLLANKAKIDAKTNDGVTPLHNAALEGHKDVAELLLAHKAEVDAKSNKGFTPLHLAAQKGHKELGELLRQYGGHK